MQLTNFYHRHRLHRLASHPDFSFFELAIWLHTLAHSLISIFVPILLVQTGYSIRDVLIYYLIFNVIDVPLNFVVDRLMRKLGARKVLILGTLAVIAFFGLLGVLPPNNWPLLILLAFLAAAYDTLFWISHFYIFIEANRGSLDAGGRVGALEAVRKMANIAGPLIGGLLLFVAGKPALVAASVAIFFMSILPIYKMRHVRDMPTGKMLSLRELFSTPQEKRDYTSMALWGIHGEVEDVLWPLFIFTLFGTIGSVAAVPFIVSVTTATLSYLAGKLTKRYATRMMVTGILVIVGAWMLRFTVHSAPLYYVTVFLTGFFSLLVSIPLDSSIVSRGLKIDSLSASTYRNALGMASRIILYLILLLFLEIFKPSFGVAVLSLLLMLLTVLAFRSAVIPLPWQAQK